MCVYLLPSGVNSAAGTITMDVNKSEEKTQEQDTNNFTADNADEEEFESYDEYVDQPSKAETGKVREFFCYYKCAYL